VAPQGFAPLHNGEWRFRPNGNLAQQAANAAARYGQRPKGYKRGLDPNEEVAPLGSTSLSATKVSLSRPHSGGAAIRDETYQDETEAIQPISSKL
jgi:hypothetical protein